MKWRQILPLLFLRMVLTGEGQQGPNKSDLEKIQSAIQLKQFDQALASIDILLKEDPTDARLLTLQGIALARLGNTERARLAYEKALRMSPNFLPALESSAELEYRLGSDRAVPLLRRILTMRPTEPTANAMLGTLSYRNHECSKAVQYFRVSTQFIEGWEDALEQYGECLMELDRVNEAIPVFMQIVQKSPDDVRSRYRLAVLQMAAHQSEQVLGTLRPLLDSGHPEAYILDLAALACEERLDTPKAVQFLREAIISDPTNVKYYLDFATIAFNHGSFQPGIDMVSAGINQVPKAAVLFVARGVLRMQLSQYAESEADFIQASRLDPTMSSGGIAIGMAAVQQRNLDQALATTEAQLKLHPEDSFLHYMKASILMQQNAPAGSATFSAAVNAALEAIKINANFVLARDTLAALYMQSGAYDQAIAQSREALKADSSDQVAVYHLLQALRHKGTASKEQLSDLTKRLVQLRHEAYEKDAALNRYKLVGQQPETEHDMR